MKKFLLALSVLALLPLLSTAQNTIVDRELQKSVKVYFRQGVFTLDENYMDNKATLKGFADEVQKYYSDSTALFRQIRVVSSVSPEGSMAINEHIAKKRAEAIAAWISKEINAEVGYSFESQGVDWELFTQLVEEDENVPYKAEVLEILQGDNTDNARFVALTKLRAGEPYRYLYKNIFSDLRYAAARCEFWWEIEPSLLVSNEPQRFSTAGGDGAATATRTVPSYEEEPVVESPVEWVTPIAMPAGSDKVLFTVAPNDSLEPRSTALTVKYNGKVYNIPIEQEGIKPVLRVTSGDKSYGPEGGQDTITYEKNVDDGVLPTAKSSADWVTVAEPTEEGINYTVAENPSQEPRETTIVVECYDEQHEVTISQAAAEAPAVCKPFYMGIKTNMLYDVALVPNIGAEFYLGKNFSIAANYAHAWWSKEAKSLFWRYYGADASIRWWFGKPSRIKPLQGHHIGVNYQILTYDFQLGGEGIMAGMPNGNLVDRANHIVSFEYGYSLPISHRLNIDFAIGFGYHWGLFEEYTTTDGHFTWQATKRRQYLGPTKLEVSLVWLIGCDNYNKDKGGKR